MATTFNSSSAHGSQGPLPDYSAVNLQTNQKPNVLITPAKKLTFPLSNEDLRDIKILETKFDAEENCAGLAAPQIGIPKQIIVFSAPDDPNLRKWRPDFTQTMGKTIWINPSYEGIGEDKHEDYEACFSVLEMAGPVKRYKAVHYKAYSVAGELIEGKAEGFLARIIQHEIDHVNGTLFIDYVPEDKLLNIETYRQRRRAALQAQQNSES